MLINRLILLAALAFTGLVACNKTQPSGVPDVSSTAPTPTTPVETVNQTPPEAPSVAVESAPPPLDSQIAPYAKTGFPDCDDYIEIYRQCLNTRMGSDERKLKASELQDSVRSIMSNIARGVDGARVAGRCKRARSLASKKLTALGCPL
ncbi:MAG: hypothetical protein ABI866_13780 [Dokdonella sp.]